ncbi:MAG: glycosyltransferase family 2 protein [Desulfomonilaceae bacterium]
MKDSKMSDFLNVSVLCRNAATYKRWSQWAVEYSDVEFTLKTQFDSYFKYLNDVIDNSRSAYVLCCHDDAWLPRQIALQVEDLITDLDSRFGNANWGLVSNAGITYPGMQPAIFVRERYGPIQHRHRSPLLVATVEGNLLLLNVEGLRNAGVRLPLINDYSGHDIFLSAECYLKGLLCIVDSRLFALEEPGRTHKNLKKLASSRDLLDYWSKMFVNNGIPRINGILNVYDNKDHRPNHVVSVSEESRRDYFSLIDDAVANSNIGYRPLSLTIIVRTQWKRELMLRRLLASIAAAHDYQQKSITLNRELKVFIVSDVEIRPDHSSIEVIAQEFHGLNIDSSVCGESNERFSRVHLLVKGIMQADSDFFWIVDDDDLVMPAALTTIFSTLLDTSTLLIADSEVILESSRTLDVSEALTIPAHSKYVGRDYVFNFSGLNRVPICSVVYPSLVRYAINEMSFHGDYYEDYALLITALTCKEVNITCIPQTICRVSVRGIDGGNTITEVHRDRWYFSTVSFMNELLNAERCGPQILWDITLQLQNAQNRLFSERWGSFKTKFIAMLRHGYLRLRPFMSQVKSSYPKIGKLIDRIIAAMRRLFPGLR